MTDLRPLIFATLPIVIAIGIAIYGVKIMSSIVLKIAIAVLTVAATVGYIMLFQPSFVSAANPDPPLIVLEAQAFSCLLTQTAATMTDCDLLIMIRYELPKENWRELSGGDPLYMEEVACFNDNENNFLDLCYTSLLPGMVTHTFYDGPQTTGILKGVRTLPRISHGLSAVYLAAGHDLSLGDTTYESCIELDVLVFTPAVPICTTLIWNLDSATNTILDADSDGLLWDDAKTLNAVAVASIGADIQTAYPGRTMLINNTLITPLGAVFFAEAFDGWPNAAPDAFSISTGQNEPFVVNNSATQLETNITTDAGASILNTFLTNWSTNHFGGISIQVIGGVIVSLVAGVIVMIILMTFPQNGIYFAGLILVIFLWFAVLQDLIQASIYLTIFMILAGVGFAKWARNTFA